MLLGRGERKSIATDRVILIPGPRHEIDIVNQIFRLYAEKSYSSEKIATALNECRISGEDGRPWTRHIIRRMVTNPKYIGANAAKLRSCRVQNRPDMWIRRDDAFEAIVNRELFRERPRPRLPRDLAL